MDTTQAAVVRADSASRVAQACKEAAEAVMYAGDYAGTAWQDGECQREKRQQARAILDALAALAQSAAEAAAEAAADVPEALANTRYIADVDKSAAACSASAARFTRAWGL